MNSIIRVYDRNMKKIAYLQNAMDIGYDLKLNELWTAKFSLPAGDPKNKYCEPFNYVEIFDGTERIELFRIMPSILTRSTTGIIEYECEHVLATLMDDIMFKFHQIGNIGYHTPKIIRYILDKQTTPRWQLHECDFDRQFEYTWENENLLAALFSVANPLDERYVWEFNTTGTVWRLSLKKLKQKYSSEIIYRKNMLEIKKEIDPTTLANRIYCLGYGEGDNQLTIESVNKGVPYLQDDSSVARWGLKMTTLVDRRFENAETLKAYAENILKESKDPYKMYTTSALDLYQMRPDLYSRFYPGDVVRVIDKEDGIIEDLPIIGVSKDDIRGDIGTINIEIGNKNRDIAGSISELQERTRINEVYAQGATNQLIINFADNADNRYPAEMYIYIPDTMIRINKLILNYKIEQFRAYSKALTTQEASFATAQSGGGGWQTSQGGGGTTQDTGSSGVNVRWARVLTDTAQNHRHYFDRVDSHQHVVRLDNHVHDFRLDGHMHDVRIAGHGHDILYGIYLAQRANYIDLVVDGKTVYSHEPNKDINIIDYLSTDDKGKIRRNTWHKVEMRPNTMSRIVANAFMQLFTNSRGGGDY